MTDLPFERGDNFPPKDSERIAVCAAFLAHTGYDKIPSITPETSGYEHLMNTLKRHRLDAADYKGSTFHVSDRIESIQDDVVRYFNQPKDIPKLLIRKCVELRQYFQSKILSQGLNRHVLGSNEPEVVNVALKQASYISAALKELISHLEERSRFALISKIPPEELKAKCQKVKVALGLAADDKKALRRGAIFTETLSNLNQALIEMEELKVEFPEETNFAITVQDQMGGIVKAANDYLGYETIPDKYEISMMSRNAKRYWSLANALDTLADGEQNWRRKTQIKASSKFAQNAADAIMDMVEGFDTNRHKGFGRGP